MDSVETMINKCYSFMFQSVQFEVYIKGAFGNTGINILPNQLMELYYPSYFEKLPQLLENTPPRFAVYTKVFYLCLQHSVTFIELDFIIKSQRFFSRKAFNIYPE